MNSGTVLAGTDGLTAMTYDPTPMLATGAMSRMKLKLRLSERRIDGVRRHDLHEECVTVRRGARDEFGANIAAGPRPVLDDELLPEPLRQRLSQEARDDVGCIAGRKTKDDAHRPRRIGLRQSAAQRGRERGSSRCQMEKSSAGQFHSITSVGGGEASQTQTPYRT